jgi:hypothetical protein
MSSPGPSGSIGPGSWSSVAALYPTILERELDQDDALHLPGVVRYQAGRSQDAVELTPKAVALRSGAAAFHANVAEAYRALGWFDRAVGCCRTALKLWRDYPEPRMFPDLIGHTGPPCDGLADLGGETVRQLTRAHE